MRSRMVTKMSSKRKTRSSSRQKQSTKQPKLSNGHHEKQQIVSIECSDGEVDMGNESSATEPKSGCQIQTKNDTIVSDNDDNDEVNDIATDDIVIVTDEDRKAQFRHISETLQNDIANATSPSNCHSPVTDNIIKLLSLSLRGRTCFDKSEVQKLVFDIVLPHLSIQQETVGSAIDLLNAAIDTLVGKHLKSKERIEKVYNVSISFLTTALCQQSDNLADIVKCYAKVFMIHKANHDVLLESTVNTIMCLLFNEYNIGVYNAGSVTLFDPTVLPVCKEKLITSLVEILNLVTNDNDIVLCHIMASSKHNQKKNADSSNLVVYDVPFETYCSTLLLCIQCSAGLLHSSGPAAERLFVACCRAFCDLFTSHGPLFKHSTLPQGLLFQVLQQTQLFVNKRCMKVVPPTFEFARLLLKKEGITISSGRKKQDNEWLGVIENVAKWTTHAVVLRAKAQSVQESDDTDLVHRVRSGNSLLAEMSRQSFFIKEKSEFSHHSRIHIKLVEHVLESCETMRQLLTSSPAETSLQIVCLDATLSFFDLLCNLATASIPAGVPSPVFNALYLFRDMVELADDLTWQWSQAGKVRLKEETQELMRRLSPFVQPPWPAYQIPTVVGDPITLHLPKVVEIEEEEPVVAPHVEKVVCVATGCQTDMDDGNGPRSDGEILQALRQMQIELKGLKQASRDPPSQLNRSATPFAFNQIETINQRPVTQPASVKQVDGHNPPKDIGRSITVKSKSVVDKIGSRLLTGDDDVSGILAEFKSVPK